MSAGAPPGLTLLLGGSRSGKSTLAVRLAHEYDGPVTYIATCPRIEGDAEIAERIADHEAERPPSWATIEAELDLAAALRAADDSFVVIDCLTLWVGNLQHRGDDLTAVTRANDEALAAAGGRSAPTVVVSNEVGLGIVPDNPGVREYRDLLGHVNQRWAAASDRALFMIAGRAIPLVDPADLLR